MSDRIEIRGLRVLGHHGALAGEQDVAQPFELDLDVSGDFSQPELRDDLADAIDYATVITVAASVVETRRFSLLEALAGAVAGEVLALGGAEEVTVSVAKLRPPVPFDVRSVAVRVTRRAPR